MTLSIVFMGTPAFSVPVLEAVHDAGHRIVAVYAQPPRPAGRGMAEVKSPVQLKAEALGIPVITPLNFKGAEERAHFASLGADAAVVVAYGLLLPQAVLDAPRLGCFNVHASKLPRWRGAAPIQRAIMAGDAVTGVSIMRMDAGLDTGPVTLEADVPIAMDTTAGMLHDALSAEGARLMVEALEHLEAGTLSATPQTDAGVTYAAKIDKAEAAIDFSKAAADVVRHIHGLSPAPGAYFSASIDGAAQRIKVLSAATADGQGTPGVVLDGELTIACGKGAIRPLVIQRAGRKAAPSADVMRGFPIPPGTRLT